jgi:hypothetical protein
MQRSIEKVMVSVVVLVGLTDVVLAEEGSGFSFHVDSASDLPGGSTPPFNDDPALRRRERVLTIHDREQQGVDYFRSGQASRRDPASNVGAPLDWTIIPRRSPKGRPVTARGGVPWKTTPTWWVKYDLSKSGVPYRLPTESWWGSLFSTLEGSGVIGLRANIRFKLTPDPIIDWEQQLGAPAAYAPKPEKPARSIGSVK